ncbi:MAG: HD domain-containing phosphohydrolase [Anaerolineaceae bacterium]
MTHYIDVMHKASYKRLTNPVKESIDRWSGLSNLSRFLLETNTLHELMENTARSVVELLGLDFCHILTFEANGHYYCRMTFNPEGVVVAHPVDTPITQIAEKIFQEVAHSEPALVPYHLGEAFSPQEFLACAGTLIGNIWLVPLCANSQQLGFLVLGKKSSTKAEDYLIESTHLVDLIAGQLSNALMRVRLNERLSDKTLEVVQALTKALEVKDIDSSLHSQHMANLSNYLAQKVGCSEKESLDIYWAALLHDIGKIGVEDRILHKPGPLTDDEWVIMKKHPQIGAKIVQGMTGLDRIAPLILMHHERLDGSGYPHGLAGDQIPMGARIIAVVDSYTTITEGRTYRAKRTSSEAIEELTRLKGKLYDSAVVDAFVSLVDFSH